MERIQTDEFVTLPEASRRTGIGMRQFRRAIENDELPVYDIGGWPRLRRLEIVEWIESRRRRNSTSDLGLSQ